MFILVYIFVSKLFAVLLLFIYILLLFMSLRVIFPLAANTFDSRIVISFYEWS